MSFCKGFSQGGSNADVVITDAFLKGITDGVDWDTAYEAVISDAEGELLNAMNFVHNATRAHNHRTGLRELT